MQLLECNLHYVPLVYYIDIGLLECKYKVVNADSRLLYYIVQYRW